MSGPYFVLFLLLLIKGVAAYGQDRTQTPYYLIDSLDLEALSENDRSLIDSAMAVYHKCSTDTCRVNAISMIVEESWDENVWPKYNRWVHDFVLEKLTQSSDSAVLYHLKKSYAGALNNIGYLHNSKGQIDEALEYYDKTLSIQNEIDDKTGMAGTLINTGYIFLHQGLIEKALEYYYNSLKIEEELKNQRGIATALNGIGYIHYKQGDAKKAFESYSRSLEIREELNDKYGIATCLNNIGLIFRDSGRWETALDYYQKCLRIEEELADRNGMAISKGNIGFVYRSLGRWDEALTQYSEGLRIMEELDDKVGISHALNNIAGVMLVQSDLKNARTYARRSLELAEELNYPRYIRDAAETLAGIAKKENNWKESLRYFELYIRMRDSVFNKETLTATIHQQYKYQYEKRTLTDSIRNVEQQKMKDTQLAASEAESGRLRILAAKRRQQSWFLVMSLLMVLLFAGLIFNRLKVIKRQKVLIGRQKEELEDVNRELKQFASVTSHDLKTPLRGISNLVTMLEKDYPDMDGELREYFGLIKTRSVKMHGLINGILAYSKTGRQGMTREKVNINALLESVIDQVSNDKGVEIKALDDFPELVCNKTQMEQIFSNLIDNAVKYNHHERNEGIVTIGYASPPGFHEFIISDNGPGIRKNMHATIFELFKKSHDHGPDSTGIGLSIVKKLVTQNGGAIALESDVGKGAVFRFTWPM